MVTAAMSFKRDGDDPGELGVLQKRRVADLLASYIPTEEALLLRSGRYACTVCPQRPVFDTLAMLTVHRAGRKHVAALRSFYGGKQQLGKAAPEPPHAEPAPQDSAAPLLARTRSIARNALLKAAPYSSRCRRTGAAGGGSGAAAVPQPGLSPPGDTEATSAALLPGGRVGDPGTPSPAAAPPRSPASSRSASRSGGKGKAPGTAARQRGALGTHRNPALERYLQLRSAGWIQDRSGKWVKDENAEFDSDEDEPPGLPPGPGALPSPPQAPC